MALVYKEYALNETTIDTISAVLQDYLNGLKTERRNAQRIRLTVEELLLNIMERCGNVKISFGIGKQFGRHLFRLRYETVPFDPTKSSENAWADDMMRSLGFFPSWSYKGRLNTVSLVLADKPKRSMLFYIVLAIFAAILLGIAGRWMPDTLRQSVGDTLLTPVADGFLGLLGTFSGVMIFLTICNGILGMGDSATIGRTGKSVLLRFIGISFAISVCSVVLVLPFLHLNFSKDVQGQASPFYQISRMFFDILPTNPVEPFQTGNTLQLIVIAMFVGVGLLAIGERGSRIRGIVDESATLMQHTVSSICLLVPLFVFVTLLKQIWLGQAQVLLSIVKPVVLIVACVLFVTAILWMISAFRLKCAPLMLMKKTLPPFLVGFTTASSMTALPLGMETCEKKLGVQKNIVSFVYPLGSVIYKPASVVFFTLIVCTLAEIYQVEVGLAWLFTAVITATLIAIAMPPIPGADILCYTILFSGLGIPSEALVLATAIGIVLDYFDTGFNIINLLFQITCEAKRIDKLDWKALLRE